jgi:hypothetical protein
MTTTIDQLVANVTAKVQAIKDKNVKINNMPADPAPPQASAPTFTSTGKAWKDAQK